MGGAVAGVLVVIIVVVAVLFILTRYKGFPSKFESLVVFTYYLFIHNTYFSVRVGNNSLSLFSVREP